MVAATIQRRARTAAIWRSSPVDEAGRTRGRRSGGRPNSRVDLDLALPVFGVDDPHAGRRDRDVVDVAAAARHPAIVQRDDSVGVGASRERVGDGPFRERALLKRRFMLRGATESEDQAPDTRVGAPRAVSRLRLRCSCSRNRPPRAVRGQAAPLPARGTSSRRPNIPRRSRSARPCPTMSGFRRLGPRRSMCTRRLDGA